MSLDKAIRHGKENRKLYIGSKAFDPSCRNHGGCPFCISNRLHASRKREAYMNDQMEDVSLMRIFLSQPMRGLTDEQIQQDRKRAISYLLQEYPGAEVVESFFKDFHGHPLDALGRSICLLSTADLLCLLPGWQNARGCRVEEFCAQLYGIPSITLE